MQAIDGSLPGLRHPHPLLLATLLAILVSFAGIGSHSLWSPDEPTGAAVGRAMYESGDLVVPRLNGRPFLEKPPLYWWVQMAAFHAFGFSAAAARLPSALFGCLTLLTTYALGRRLGRPRTGLLAAAVLGSTLLFVEEVGRVVVDPALAFFVALTHLGFAVLAAPRSPAERRWALGSIAAAVPLAFLAKGVVALGLAVAPPVCWLLATRRMRALRDLLLLAALGVPLFALFVVPWAVALYRAAGWPALQECLFNNTVDRFFGGRQAIVYGHEQPWWYYVTTALAVQVPWSLALPAMLRAGVLRRGPDRPRPAAAEARALLFATFVVGIVLLSAAASKRELYLLPLLPAYSACVAWWLDGVGERRAEGPWDRPTLILLAVLAAVLPLLLWGLALLVKWAPPTRAALPPLQAGLSPPVLAALGLAALAGSGSLAVHLWRNRRRGPNPAWIVAAFLLLFLVLETGVKALVDPVKRMTEMTAAVAEYLPGSGPVAAYLPVGVSNESVFGIIGFELGRRVLPLTTADELRAYFEKTPGALVVFRVKEVRRLPPELLGRLHFVYDETGRKASPYAIAGWNRVAQRGSGRRIAAGGQRMDSTLTTTAFTLDGYAVKKNLGVVRGITVRSRSIFGTIGGSLQTLVGGNITLFSELCEKTRAEAFDMMVQHAQQLGANAVVGIRYDATEIMQGVTEVLCYGTAVVVQPG
jgi:4-amino-4-deoxy-L-arabinose transferase-like glycosyltransferase/uncharacterized protein YbjQ (UPF0145 family)